METRISKSRFKARALEYFRQVERTGQELIITDRDRRGPRARRTVGLIDQFLGGRAPGTQGSPGAHGARLRDPLGGGLRRSGGTGAGCVLGESAVKGSPVHRMAVGAAGAHGDILGLHGKNLAEDR